MLISHSWLKEFVDLSGVSPEDLAQTLTLRVAEVEEIHDMAASLQGMVVGKIVSAEKHPNADALTLCKVDVGKKKHVQVVCGGSNVAPDMDIAFAGVGTKVRWHGEGELVELQDVTIRGEKSSGMICASDEIGVASMFPKKEEKEILDLSHIGAAPGTPLAEALGLTDIVFDIENKTLTHRPDLWGHYGMAREIGALLQKDVTPYTPPAIVPGSDAAVTVDVQDTVGCPRYMGVVIDGVTVGPSPAWLQKRLEAVGVNSINNIVDATNYVMLESGQPLHAFDAEMIADQTIIVRKAKEDEAFVSLDEKNYSLDSETLVIADANRVLAVAGVKGGVNSGVTETTTRIILEAANFDATMVRRASTRLGLRTDASMRFEKSLDPVGVATVMERAVEVLLQVSPGAQVASPVTDSASFTATTEPITFSVSLLQEKAWHAIAVEEATDMLERLGFGVTVENETYCITVPSWRATKDIEIAEDIIEEVIRVYGYEHIPSTLPKFSTQPPVQETLRTVERRVRTYMAHECGYTEVYSYSFVSPQTLEKLGIDSSEYIALNNPIAKDRPLVRRSLVPNMLEHIESNMHEHTTLSLFEVGKVFRGDEEGETVAPDKKEKLPKQDTYGVAMFVQKGEETPYFEVAGVLAGLCNRLRVSYELVENKERAATDSLTHPGRVGYCIVDGKEVGMVAELHPAAQKAMGISARVGVLELNLSLLATCIMGEKQYHPLPQYPSVERDIALVVDTATAHADIATAITMFDDLIVETSLFDVYEGKGVEDGKKSMAYRVVYRSHEKTLQVKEVEEIHAELLALLEKKFGATMRA